MSKNNQYRQKTPEEIKKEKEENAEVLKGVLKMHAQTQRKVRTMNGAILLRDNC